MYCFSCGVNVKNQEVCPNCGADLHIMQKAVRLSNAYYNDGLAKASVRNLSGALVSLKTSLRFYKYNIDARNLLGLVLYEMGETVDALSEWVISKNYQPKENLASRYLDEIQSNRSNLETLNQTIKKYNQALLYCKSDSRDLATIQLKKVLSMNPKMVKAHQLLALLYIQEEKYELAKKTLRNAGKIDTDNTTTLRYLKEVNARLKEKNPNKKSKNDELISYTNGNETIIMPKRFKESSLGSTLLAVAIGLVVGIAATAFLIIPNVRYRYKEEARKQLVAANDTISTQEQTIKALNKEIENLNGSLEDEKGTSEVVMSRIDEYDTLLNAYMTYVGGDAVAAGETLSKVDEEKLSQNGKNIYNSIKDQTMPQYLTNVYNAGYAAINSGENELAIENLVKVCDIDMAYQDGNACFYLAQAYETVGDEENAASYYQYILDNYPNTSRAQTAEEFLNK